MRNTKLAAWVTAACVLGDSAFYVVLPVLYFSFGVTTLWEVGVLLSVNRFVRLPLHTLVKRYYREPRRIKSGFLWGATLAFVSTISYMGFDSFNWLFFARVLWGIAWALLRQGGQLLLVEATQQSSAPCAGSLTGTYNGITRSGSLVGMAGGVAAAGLGWTDMGFLIFALAALTAIPVIAWKMHTGTVKDKKDDLSVPEAAKLSNSDRMKSVYGLLFPALLVSMVFQGILKSTLGYWVTIRDLTDVLLIGSLAAAAWTGMLQALRWGMEPAIAPWIGRRIDSGSRNWAVAMPAMLAPALLFPLLLAPMSSYVWLTIVVLIFAAAIVATTALDAKAVDFARTSTFGGQRAVVSSYLIAVDLGAAAGPLLAYALLEWAGPALVGWGASAALLTAFGFTVYETLEKKSSLPTDRGIKRDVGM